MGTVTTMNLENDLAFIKLTMKALRNLCAYLYFYSKDTIRRPDSRVRELLCDR